MVGLPVLKVPRPTASRAFFGSGALISLCIHASAFRMKLSDISIPFLSARSLSDKAWVKLHNDSRHWAWRRVGMLEAAAG